VEKQDDADGAGAGEAVCGSTATINCDPPRVLPGAGAAGCEDSGTVFFAQQALVAQWVRLQHAGLPTGAAPTVNTPCVPTSSTLNRMAQRNFTD
jgi:hypothetical protein